MIKRIQGDLLDFAENGDFHVIVHGCNCFCTMGSGIAAQIREKYPMAALVDLETTKGDINKLGNFTLVNTGKFIIINAYTQYDFNRKGQNKDMFEYASFEVILRKLAYRFGNLSYGFPLIGQGLAGGNPERINSILDNFEREINSQQGSVTLVEYKSSKRPEGKS